MILTERLANGATLLLEPVDRTDTLCIGFWFLHGSRDESSGERGYSHFLEHMLFKGTDRRSAFAIAQEIDRVGGIINAFTEKEFTCVYAIIAKEHLRLAFDVLSDMTTGSLIEAAEMEKEKTVVVNEIRSVDDSPEEKGHDRYLQEMCGDHPISRKITGEVEEVQRISQPDLVRFYRQRLVPQNTIFAVAGNFSPDEVRALAEAVFARAGSPSLPQQRTTPAWKRKVSVVPDRFNQVQVYAGTCYALDHELSHYYTSLVFSTAFGESMSCRLFQKLREQLGLCYTVYSFRTFFSDIGMWTIYASATPQQGRALLEALDAELARLLREPLSRQEIDDAKSHLAGGMILSQEDMESRMKRLVRQFVTMGRVLEFDESLAALRAVADEGIAQFARQCLRRDAFSLLAYGTKGLNSMRNFDFTFPGVTAVDAPVIKCSVTGGFLPEYQSEGASGADLRALLTEDLVLKPGTRALVPTGLCIEIPRGLEGQVRPRSGMALKNGVTVLNSPGTVDSDYRGEIKIILINLGESDFRVRNGDRIAQIVFSPVVRVSFQRQEAIASTQRGSGGFGSTGT